LATRASKHKAGQILTRRTAGRSEGCGFGLGGASASVGAGHVSTAGLATCTAAQLHRHRRRKGEARVRPRQMEASPVIGGSLHDFTWPSLLLGSVTRFTAPVSVPLMSDHRKCMRSDFTGSLHCITQFCYTHVFPGSGEVVMISSKAAPSFSMWRLQGGNVHCRMIVYSMSSSRVPLVHTIQ
jgi:hypothetical protein